MGKAFWSFVTFFGLFTHLDRPLQVRRELLLLLLPRSHRRLVALLLRLLLLLESSVHGVDGGCRRMGEARRRWNGVDGLACNFDIFLI